MKLSQILITGETNQEFRTQAEEEKSIYFIDKSLQVYFRTRTISQLLEVVSPIFESLYNLGKFDKEVLFSEFEPKPTPKVKFSKSKASSIDNWGLRRFSKIFDDVDDEFTEKKVEEPSETERLLFFDKEFYHGLYKYTFPRIAYAIFKEGGDLQTSRDIFQNALIVLLERLKNKDFKLTCTVGTYLHSVSINIYRNLRRELVHRVIQVDVSNFIEKLSERIYFDEIPSQYEMVAAIIEKMGDPCKRLLESYYFQQLSWEEIAQRNAYSSAASARNQKYKCLERIRKELQSRERAD